MELPSRFLPVLACLAIVGLSPVASAAVPTLTTISVISGGNEDQPVAIPYATLFAASNAADADDDEIEFRFESLIAGTLKKGSSNVSTNGTLGAGETWTWTPPDDANGTINAFRVRAYADGDESAADVVVRISLTAVNDAPSFGGSNVSVAEDSGAFSQSGWATSISAGPADESGQATQFAITSNSNPGLFSTAPVITASGTLTFTPAANENGVATIGVRISDDGGTANGGVNQSAIQNYTITVTPQPDNPTLAAVFKGTVAAPFNDITPLNAGGEAGPVAAQPVFQSVTIADVDHNKPNADNQIVTVTVPDATAAYGTFALSGATVANISGGKTYTLAAQSPANASSALAAATFTPFANAFAVGDYTFGITVAVKDSTDRQATPLTPTLNFESVSDLPKSTASLAVVSITDAGPVSPFRLTVSDPDLGDTFSVTITETTATPRGTLSAASITGTAAQIATAVQSLVYTPFKQAANQTATFDFDVTDVHPDGSTGTTGPPSTPVKRTLSLPILFVNDAPELTGVTTGLIRTTDDPAAPAVYPFSAITIIDADPGQVLTVTLSLGDPGQGSFTGDFTSANVISGTVDEITTKLRQVRFIPTAGRIPVNSSETVTITITLADGTATVANNQTQVEVTAVDGAPSVRWDVTAANPAGVFPSASSPALIDPSTGPKPFAKVRVQDVGQVEVTVAIDTVAKGELSNLGGFVETPAGSRSYRFTGLASAAQADLQEMIYTINPAYLFPPNQPGRTDFTINATDSALNFTSRVLPILLKSDSRSFLVTSVVDDETLAGTLRHAVAHASNNDVITFALPGYPATIRLLKSKGPLVINKHLAFRGPGADKLTITGDSNANGTTDPNDTQLFRIFASVQMKGLRLARGFATTGGAAFVGRLQPGALPGSLTVEDCVFANCMASQWGGALDVADGALQVARCVFENNSLNASSGLGGGAVSLYTNQACSFVNSTFSGNSQSAPTGFGGGALYVENDTPNNFFQTKVTHCTFAGNIDAANNGSSIHNNVSNSRVLLANNIFGDFSARNLKVAGGAEIVSSGGNISNDNTSTTFIQGGVPQQAILLNQATDKRNLDPRLAAFGPLDGPTRGHRLLPDSPAIGTAVAGVAATDQRGTIRNASADIGALDANALGKLIIHEIFASPTAALQFIEFYNPRDQAGLDVGGYEVWVDGVKRHTFTAPQVVPPGHGLILSNEIITSTPGAPVIPSAEDLELAIRGRIELRTPVAGGNKVVEAVSYVAAFADSTTPSVTTEYPDDSITLAPQFQGAAFAPHPLVHAPPNGGVVPGATGAHTSPGRDTGGTPFGESNAYPIATLDRFEINEDEAATLAVLGNDLDADGSDKLFVVDLNAAASLLPPATDKATISSPAGATVTISPAGTPLRGTAVTFDPRVAFNHLPEGARVTDSFAYSISDVGGGAVSSYADGGSGETLVTAPSHRLTTGATILIIDAGTAAYNGARVVTVVDDDHFTIPVAYIDNPAPLLRGRWQAVEIRTPSERDEALVEVTVLGRNDPPTPLADSVATDENTILRVFADPRAASVALDTDANYPLPRTFDGTGILANDTDPDTDGNPFTQLKVVGVCQAEAIAGFSGTPGSSPVTVSAPAHGLQNGTSVLISGYGGHPSYNGYHLASVIDADTFSLPIAFVDDAAAKGLWTVLNDDNRLATTSNDGAAVTLEIRANRAQTNIVYNPRTSDFLEGLADGESSTDTFYYAAEDNHGAVTLAQLSVVVAGVNNDPVPGDNPPGLAVLDPLLTGGATPGDLLGGSAVLHLLPSAGAPGRVNVSIRPPGGAFGDVLVIDGLDQTHEDLPLDLASSYLLDNDSDVDRTDVLSLEIGGGQEFSREGAAISLSGDGLTLTYDPTLAPNLQALAFKERVIDTFTITVFDGIARVNTLVAVLVEGRNDQPLASNVALTIDEKSLLEIKPPGLLLSGLDIDQDTNLPDNRKFLHPVADFPTNVFAAKVSVLLDRHDGGIDGFAEVAGTPGATAVVSPGHGLQTGEEVVLLGSGALTGQFVLNRIDDNSFSVPVDYDAGFAALGGGTWRTLGSTFQYDPRASVFSDLPGGPAYTLQGLAVGETFVDTYTYTLLDGSFLFANDDVYRIEADRSNIELRVLLNDTSLEGLASDRRIVEVGPPSAGGNVSLNGDQSLIYTPQTGFVGDEVFVYTIEDNLGNRDSAMVTARVTIDRLNGNLRANDDHFTVAAGQSPLVDVLANDNIIPATGDPLSLDAISSAPAEGGQAVIEDGMIRYTPNPSITVFPYTETFEYTMSGGGVSSASATVSILVFDRRDTLNVRADSFSVPAGSVSNTLNVLENDNILPGTGDGLEIVSVTAASHGTVTVLNGVALSYTPADGFLGTDAFSYSVNDGLGGTGTALVTVKSGYLTINSDIFSVVFDDPAKSTDDGVTVLDVLANDNVLQGGGGQLTITGISPASSALGAFTIPAGGAALEFDPAENATGQQDFTYTVTDVGGRTATGTVTVVILSGGIRASSDYFTVQADSQAVELAVLANDLRISNLPGQLSVNAIGAGLDGPDQGGTVEISADYKKLVYTPATGFRGVESFTYTVTDGDSSDTARVSVRSTDGEMIAGDDSFFVFRGSSDNRLPILANDRVLPDSGQQLFVTATGPDPDNLANPPVRGILEIIEDGAALRYTPSEANPAGSFVETFTYEISAGGTERGEGLIRIEVLNRDGARDLETNHDFFSVRSDSTGTLLPVLANDSVLPASAGTWIITEVTAPANGAVQISGGNLLYAPQPGFVGTDVFTYHVSDGAGGTGFADVAVKVGDISVSDDAYTVIAGAGAVALDVTANDGIRRTSFPDTPLPSQADFTLTDARPVTLDPVAAGSAVVDGAVVSYTPEEAFTGIATLTYWVQDDSGNLYPGIARIDQRPAGNDRDTAVVSITVTGVNDPPRMVDAETNAVTDKSTRVPFPDVTVIEYDSQRLEPVVIQVGFDGSHGELAGGGFALVSPGLIEFTGTAAEATAALRALIYTPFTNRIMVGTTEDTRFTVSMDDGHTAVPVIEDSTVTTVTPINDAPDLLEALPTATTDKESVVPFPASTIVEVDDLTLQQLVVIIDYPADHGVLAGDFDEISPGVLRFTGTAAQATTALRGLVYTPFIDRITVGTTEDTRFTVSIDDGFTAAPVVVDTAVTTVTPINDPPYMIDVIPGETDDKTPVNPFLVSTLIEVDDLTLQPLEVTISYPSEHGMLAGEGFTEISPGVTVFNGTAAEATEAMRALVFTPVIDRILIGTTEDTRFTVSIDDGFTAAPVVVDSAVITVTPVNDAPQLLGLVPTMTDDKTALNPFAGSTVIEFDDLAGQLVRITISFPANRGILSGPGFTLVAPGVLGFYGTAADATIAMRGLVFTPFTNRITVGTTEDTRFTVSIDDDVIEVPVVVDSAVTTVTPVNDVPVITGTIAGQKLYQRSTLHPFAGVNITDVDDVIIQPLQVAVTIDSAIKGYFTRLGGFTEPVPGSGNYVFNGTAAQASVALRGLLFNPTPDGRVTAIAPETSVMTVTINDGFAAPVVDPVTSVVVLHGEIDRLLPLGAAGTDISQEAAAFGTSVAVSGNTMAVGSPARDTPAVDAGRVHVYERDAGLGAPWGQVMALGGSDSVAGDRFGQAVAMDGDYLVVGAPEATVAGINKTGAVYVFHRDGVNPNLWSQVAKLASPAPNGSGGDGFGSGLAIQGGTLLVGSPNSNRTGAPRAGRVYEFRLGAGGPGNWTFAQTMLAGELRSSGLSGDGEFFGFAVALDGNTAVIGAHGANRATGSTNWNYGAAHIFTRPAAGGNWTELKRLDEFEDPTAVSYNGYGYAVDVSGDRIVVGVHSNGNPLNAFKPGGARIYERNHNGANAWGEVIRIGTHDNVPSAYFGNSVAIHDKLVLVGSPGPSQGSVNSRGSVEVFRRDAGAAPVWNRIDRFTPGSPAATDQFGFSVALDGYIGCAGATGEGVNALNVPNAGGARVYQFHYDLGPRLTLPVPDQLVGIDSAINFTLNPATFDDPVSPAELVIGIQLGNGDPLPAGGWLSFDPSTGVFSGTPTAAEHRDYQLIVTATNPYGTRVFSNAFQITVEIGETEISLEDAYAAWAANRFPPAALGDPLLESSVWGMTANPDNDLHGNLLEMLFGTDPEASEPSPLGFEKISDTRVSLTFPITAEFPLDEIHVEWSVDNVNWSRDGVVLTPSEVVPGEPRMTAVVTSSSPQERFFVRVVAGEP